MTNSTASRRSFLKGVIATAIATKAFAAHTSPKSGLDNPILGEGEHKYECLHDWLQPPEGLMWGDTHGLAQDAQGRIFVAHTVHGQSTKAQAVVTYDESGKFLSAWGDAFRGGAHGLDLRAEGDKEFLYHCDTRRHLIVKTDLAGEVVWQQGYPDQAGVYESSEKFVPTNIAFLPGEKGMGDFVVGDGYGSSYVHRYTRDGTWVKTLIKPGSEAGKVSCPHGLWVDERTGTPRLAVADRGNRRIQYFSLEGEHQGFVTEGVRMPCHFKFKGDIMLVPDLESVVTLLDKNDKVIVHLGDGHPSKLRGEPREKFIPGKFIHPHTAIFLRSGDILVAEWVPVGRITLLRKIS
jgi:hypothetical protein